MKSPANSRRGSAQDLADQQSQQQQQPTYVTTSAAPDDFCNSFWGEGSEGFEALTSKVKAGSKTLEDLRALYKERASIEEDYAKRLGKLSRTHLGRDEHGAIRLALDRVRIELANSSDAHEKLAAMIRTSLEAKTREFEAAREAKRKNPQAAIDKAFKAKREQEGLVTKARDKYRTDCVAINGLSAQTSLTQGKDYDKVSAKLDKAQQTVQVNAKEYQVYSDALRTTTEKWNLDWKSYCDLAQDLEEERLNYIRISLWEYANGVSFICVTDDEFCENVRRTLEQCDAPADLRAFVKERGTGPKIFDPPPYVNFERGDHGHSHRPITRTANFSRSSARIEIYHTGQSLQDLANAIKPGTSLALPSTAPVTPVSEAPRGRLQDQAADRRGNDARSRSRPRSQAPTETDLRADPNAATTAQSQYAMAPRSSTPNLRDEPEQQQQQLDQSPTKRVAAATPAQAFAQAISEQRQQSSPANALETDQNRQNNSSNSSNNQPADPASLRRQSSRTSTRAPYQQTRQDASSTSQQQQRPTTPSLSTEATTTAGAFREAASSSANRKRANSGASYTQAPRTPVTTVYQDSTSTTQAPASSKQGSETAAAPPPKDATESLAARLAALRDEPPPPSLYSTTKSRPKSSAGSPATAMSPNTGSAPRPLSVAQAQSGRPDPRAGSPYQDPRQQQQQQQQGGPVYQGRPASPAMTGQRQSMPQPNMQAQQAYRAASPAPQNPMQHQQAQAGNEYYNQGQPGNRLARGNSHVSQRGQATSSPAPSNQQQMQYSQGPPSGYAPPFNDPNYPARQPSPAPLAYPGQPQHRGSVPTANDMYAPTYNQQPQPVQYQSTRPVSPRPQSSHSMHPSQYGQNPPRSASPFVQQAPNNAASAAPYDPRAAQQRPPSVYNQQYQSQGPQQAPAGQRPGSMSYDTNLSAHAAPTPAQLYAQQQGAAVQPQQVANSNSIASSIHRTASTQSFGGGYHQSAPQPAVAYQRAPSPVPVPAQAAPVTPGGGQQGRPVLFFVRAIYDYQASVPDEFSFQADDIIAVFQTDPDGWWQGELLDENRRHLGGTTFPSNFCTLLE